MRTTIKAIDGGLSISDDDICADCHFLRYFPGDLSLCTRMDDHHRWPGLLNQDMYFITCVEFLHRTHIVIEPNEVCPPEHKGTFPKFELTIYYGQDGTPVIEIDTSNLDEDKDGPIVRVWLNDSAIFENPELCK